MPEMLASRLRRGLNPLLAIALLCLLTAAAQAQTTRPIPQAQRVVIISIDGCRPDVLLRADCPNIRSLMKEGSFTFWARTTAVAITLPSHMSMLTGVPPQKHGIVWNDDLPLKEPVYPRYPTLFELAKKAGYTTALVSGKAKFKQFDKPGTIDYPLITDSKDDRAVASDAVKVLREHQPQVLFVHFPQVDTIGHATGWGTDEQINQLHVADDGIGKILSTLDDLKLRDQTVVLVTADHGGAGRTHGADDVRSRHIPWIISGPGIRKDYDLTRVPTLEVNTEDTFGTACYLLGITPKRGTDGKPIKEVFSERESLTSGKTR